MTEYTLSHIDVPGAVSLRKEMLEAIRACGNEQDAATECGLPCKTVPITCGCGRVPRATAAHYAEPEDYTIYLVECLDCGVATEWFDSEEEAVAAWNRHMGDDTAYRALLAAAEKASAEVVRQENPNTTRAILETIRDEQEAWIRVLLAARECARKELTR